MWNILKISLVSIALAGGSVMAQGQCLMAGRVNDAGQWAPKTAGMELLDAKGRRVAGAGAAALSTVAKVRVSRAAVISTCDGNAALAEGGAGEVKTAVPAVSPGRAPLSVSAVNFPKLKIGGTLVELQVDVPASRVTQIKR